MKKEITLQTRREFLRSTVLTSALSWTVPTFLANTFSALQADAAERATQIATGKDSTILVILQMAGGNDGINTVIPHASDFYFKARPRIAIPAKDVLKLSDQVGLNPALTGFKELYDAGELSVIQGVGYPNPNRSHFRSTEIWQTASDSNRYEKYGWVGRYFDNACAGCDPTVGVNVGRQMPQAFAAKIPKGVSVDNPQNYRFIGSDGDARKMEASFHELNEDDGSENSGGTIAAIDGPTARTKGSPLDFLERTALDAQVSSDEIRKISSRTENKANYPASQLGNSLKLVAKLIGGGLPTRIFYVSQGGYDTHTNQVGTHARLLKDLGDSVKSFCDDMKAQGNMQRVLLMTFSEFGRRVSDNANGGTDHGAAAPMFVVGNKVRAGLLGEYPSLAPADLFEGDIKYKVDFRSVYASVLENWLKTRSEPILGKKFTPLQIV
ncbi:MAG TPA: DUF1501 domain-containing protein [Verrucomicrobiae bacterium]|nr:DUF1501 domain-containing protein [Verrucomicrobiae bacterium]